MNTVTVLLEPRSVTYFPAHVIQEGSTTTFQLPSKATEEAGLVTI